MKKFIFIGMLLVILIVGGCNGADTESSDENLLGNKPPHVSVEVDGERYETSLGSYCWDIDSTKETTTTQCVDSAGPKEILKGKDPIQIKAGQLITFKMDDILKPNQNQLTEIQNEERIEIEVNDHQFTAPDKPGIYYYDYGLSWIDEEVENTVNASANYAFVIEVK